MPTEEVSFDVEGKKYQDFTIAMARAGELYLKRREAIVVTEHGPNGTCVYNVTVMPDKSA